MKALALFAVCCPVALLAQTAPVNSGFDEGTVGQTPPGWWVPTQGYQAEIRHEGCKSGAGCAVLLPPAAPSKMPFGNLMQQFSGKPFGGKTVRLRAWIRVEQVEAGDHAQMWLRVDRPGQPMGLFNNMADRPIRSSEWGRYEISGEVEADAGTINIGVILYGKGRVWVDDVSFEVVEKAGEPVGGKADGKE